MKALPTYEINDESKTWHLIYTTTLLCFGLFLKNCLKRISKTKMTVLLLCCLTSVNVRAQHIIVLDSITQHHYEVKQTQIPNVFSIAEWHKNKLIKSAKFLLIDHLTYVRKYQNKKYGITHTLPTFFSKLYDISILDQALQPSGIKIDRNAIALLTDSLTRFNVLGECISLQVFESGKLIEVIDRNGSIITYHSKLVNSMHYDTVFLRHSYIASQSNIRGQVQSQTTFKNGKYETIERDKKNTFKSLPFVKYTNGKFVYLYETDDEGTQFEAEAINNNRYLLKGRNVEETGIQNQMMTIERRPFLGQKGRKAFYNDNRYRIVEIKNLDQNGKVYTIKRYNHEGELVYTYLRNLDRPYDYDNPSIPQYKDFIIYVSKNKLTYRCNRFKGSFEKHKKIWTGTDTFYNDHKTIVTKISVNDSGFSFTRYLNGEFLSSGTREENYYLLLNHLDEDEIEIGCNDFFFQLHTQFHNSNIDFSAGDSIKIGKDSILTINYSENRLKLNFHSGFENRTIFSQTGKYLSFFKDQQLCAMGARDESGNTIIPAKFDEIENIYFSNHFRGYLCSVNDVATILDNNGKTIIQYRKGLSKQSWRVSESFRKHHNLLYPLLFICNNISQDSFELVDICDRVILSGKGQLSLFDNQYIIIKKGEYRLLMNQNGYIYNDSSIAVRPISPGNYILTIKDKLLPGSRFSHDKKTGHTKILKNNYSFKYKLIDINKEKDSGEVFNELIEINYKFWVLKRPGMTLIKHNEKEILRDTANIMVHMIQNEHIIRLKHYNQYGLFLLNNMAVIPPIYDEITYSYGCTVAKRGNTWDIYSSTAEFKFSIKVPSNTCSDRGVNYNLFANSFIQHFNTDYYSFPIANLYGLYDANGKVILRHEYDHIQVLNAYESKDLNESHTMPIYNDDLVIKVLKNSKGSLLIYNSGKLTLIESKVMWQFNQPSGKFLIKPNGEIFPGQYQFEMNPYNSIFNLYDLRNHSLLMQLDILGNVIYDASKYKLVKTIDHVTYVQLFNDKCGTLNAQFEIEIYPEYSELFYDKVNKRLWYKYGYANELWKLKILNSKLEVEDSFDFPLSIHSNKSGFVYSKNRKFGFMNIQGKVLVAPEYDRYVQDRTHLTYLFSKGNRYFAWSDGGLELVPQHYVNLFKIVENGFTSNPANNYIGFKDYKMYLVGTNFKARDSSVDMFFERSFTSKDNKPYDPSESPFTIQKRFNLSHINSLIKYTRPVEWSGLYAANSFPINNHNDINASGSIIDDNHIPNNHIRFSEYVKLDYLHMKDINLYLFSNSKNTISYKYGYNNICLNVYIDSLLGYMVFNLNQLFKGSGSDSLTEKIRSKWLAMDDPLLPCIEKKKILENFEQMFTITGDKFSFHINKTASIEIPIAELKPFMTEFWQKRF